MFLVLPLVLKAEIVKFDALSDSLRRELRLSSFLFVDHHAFEESDMDKLFAAQIPLAFQIDSANSSFWEDRLSRSLPQQKLIPVIADFELSFSTSNKLVVITPDQLDQMSLKQWEKDTLTHQKAFTIRELLQLRIDHQTEGTLSSLMKLWRLSGKMPNFLSANYADWEQTADLVTALNKHPKIFGVVLDGEKPLENVNWKGYPGRNTNGCFSFPIPAGGVNNLVPYKAGYQFSPDIIMDSPVNLHFPKLFKAVKLAADYGLTDHFIFKNGEIYNTKRPDNEDILNHGVRFVEDPERGGVAWFEDRAYLDAGIQSRTILHPNFTITAWIKPTELDNNNSILGKGRDFVMKLHDGGLTYTMQGVKDYWNKNVRIPVDQWTFIGLVHSEYNNQISFYVNGELVGQEQLVHPYKESDYTLLIGSNLWEEFFVGYMDEVKIWERELSDAEMLEQYTGTQVEPKRYAYYWAWAALFFLVLWILFRNYIRVRQQLLKRREKHSKEEPQLVIPEPSQTFQEKVSFFGGLKLINETNENLALKLSPKLKQLFILIFLHSVDGQQGISTKQLSGILWPGMSPQKAKNTRGTNIQNLKTVLASCSHIRLVFQNKLWFLEIDEPCYSDYADALYRVRRLEQADDLSAIETELPRLLAILKKGSLLPSMNESWLDPYISRTSDRIIDLGIKLFQLLDQKKHTDLIYEVAEVISLHDPLNEPALQKKLNILTQDGKLGLARSVYDHFKKLYFEMYQEDYPKDFKILTSR